MKLKPPFVPLSFLSYAFTLFIVLAFAVDLSHARTVKIDSHALWPTHILSPLAEVSEFIHDSSPALFWDYVNSLCEKSQAIEDLVSRHRREDSRAELEILALEAGQASLSLSPSSNKSNNNNNNNNNNLISLLETSIHLGAYSPAVAFSLSLSRPFSSTAEDRCGPGKPFLVVYPSEEILCDAAESIRTLASTAVVDAARPEPSISSDGDAAWEHRLRSLDGPSSKKKKVILYGAIGTASFCSAHASLSSFFQSQPDSDSEYVVRHHLSEFEGESTETEGEGEGVGVGRVSSTTTLQGYGVFLDIKNMEYKNVDDRKDDSGKEDKSESNSGESSSSSAVSFSEGEAINGIIFSTLLERKPALGEELKVLREILLEKSTEAAGIGGDGREAMKVWKMRDLGLQTIQAIVQSKEKKTSDIVSKMSEIVHNFPLHAPMLSSIKVLPSVREEVSDLWERGFTRIIPYNSLFINGRKTDLDGNTFNIFDVLTVVRSEYASMEGLNRLGLGRRVAARLKDIAVKLTSSSSAGEQGMMGMGGGKIIRVDASKGGKHAIIFFNNLEKDVAYKRWPKTVKQLMYPSWSLQTIARNLFTAIVVVDPLSAAGSGLFLQTQMMLQQQYPIRFGLVLSCRGPADDDQTLEDANAASASERDVCVLFQTAKSVYGIEHAIAFINSVCEMTSMLAMEGGGTMGGMGMGDEDGYEMLPDGSIVPVSSSHSGMDPNPSGNDENKKRKATVEDLLELFSASISQSKGSRSSEKYVSEARAALAISGHSDAGEDKHGVESFITNSSLYLQARGFPVNSFSLNGIVRVGEDLGQGLMQLLGREQFLLAQMVQKGVLTDRTKSVYSLIMSQGSSGGGGRTVYGRYHPVLEDSVPVYADLLAATKRQSNPLDGSITFFSVLQEPDADLADSATDQIKIPQHPLFNTTVLYVYPDRKGLRAALSALYWLKKGDSDSDGYSDSDSEGSRTEVSDIGANRIGIVVNVPSHIELCLSSPDGCQYGPEREGEREEYLFTAILHGAQRVLGSEGGPEAVNRMIALLEALTKTSHSHSSDVMDTITSMASSSSSSSTSFSDILTDGSMRIEVAKALRVSAEWRSLLDPSSEGNRYLLFYNGRVISIEDGFLHPQDLELISSIEQERLGGSVTSLIASERKKVEGKGERSAPSLYYSSHSTDDYLAMLSFCGRYGSSGGTRFDVDASLEELGFGSGNVFVQEIKPSPRQRGDLEAIDGEGEDVFIPDSDVAVHFVVDPLSTAGQRAAALMKLFRDKLRLPLTVILTPRPEITEFPLQNFYRYVAGEAVAVFGSLPRQHTLTVRMDPPEPWNIQATHAVQDIDNLRCEAVSSLSSDGGLSSSVCGDPDPASRATETTKISYTLKNLLVAGQCFQTSKTIVGFGGSGVPPNGLQLTLTELNRNHRENDCRAKADASDDRLQVCTDAADDGGSEVSRHQSDTLVMQNLGYFQLQASPGLWGLQLAEGRASDLYTIDDSRSITVDDNVTGQMKGILVSVRSYSDAVKRITVTKRPGMESENLLEDSTSEQSSRSEGSSSMWNSISGLFGGGGGDNGDHKKTASSGDDGKIHVFSLATGHMYERLLRIMMLSVTKRTSMPVKFWLFENYLSPTFKDIAAVMAREYAFEIGYVTYKWPQWLTQQTQKQRIIWGYKILFLDVLFPLSVKKVIYVDADQVIRADLKELWDMDLKGKPYAYTPFCSSREETLGFQFWRQGYWADHLRGKPYHISALYVVDLQTFRRRAVGDQLRAVYDNLARDPNSLANLDQDLPNYAQHSVPIHSLPQEWLWCETWCSDDSKSKAKTIDLCNNPLHKEPKLDMARRVISGKLFNESWVELDEEIRALESRSGLASAQ